jgi:hypothetical protein
MEINKRKTLFILDWDDTLFPTKWAFENNINLLVSTQRDQYMIYFQELDRVLSSFLKTVTKLGKVIIVTNALIDWINISSVMLPQTYQLLRKVRIVSAKGTYRSVSNNIMDWKIMAFRDIIDDEFKNASLMNVISVGDAEYEYQALIALNGRKKEIKKYLKSVRFVKNPSHDILIDQLEVLNDAIPDVWQKYNHLDLKFDHVSNRKKRA